MDSNGEPLVAKVRMQMEHLNILLGGQSITLYPIEGLASGQLLFPGLHEPGDPEVVGREDC